MISLIDLELDLSRGGIDNDMGVEISSGLGKLSNLNKLNLVLVDNYIDNFGFEIMLDDFGEIKEVVLDVVLNNIVSVDKYVLENIEIIFDNHLFKQYCHI
jgi:hypothetical protein